MTKSVDWEFRKIKKCYTYFNYILILRGGNTMKIGTFSASTPITALSPNRYARARRFLATQGVTLVAGNLTGQRDSYRAGSIKERAAEINALIHDDSLDILMATIGGTNANSVLAMLDYEYLNQHPKTIVGYSDATAVLLAVQTHAPNCRVIYGPALVASLGALESEIVTTTWQNFLTVYRAAPGQAVTEQAPAQWTDEAINWETFEHPKHMHANTWHYTATPVLAGRLIGGNLNTMYGFFNSPYFPKLTGNELLFIEDAEKTAATLEKNFVMLALAGVFDQISGIILGKHALYDDQGSGRLPIDILQEVLGDRQLPIIYDYDSCHTVPMLSTPLGADVRIDAQARTVTFSHF
ncbi:S66 family peptidase [Lactiplantibacillus argentoratensis]|uniref:LD-carboxypeptidase n=1 Tax=Lactiplantibacillus argentoratensis TaxID=271881 RepID=A0ABS5UHE5_9LACO|nr:S66 peptidase family protein [Lactiplantibacillus argentoratensis]MBT1137986.1 LD-carboxypeptidase [Lactiplantibacillus argentoratensis]MBT1140843.1 LD-carboxypeptidase [Lactiplantibacillus argentoratensis]